MRGRQMEVVGGCELDQVPHSFEDPDREGGTL
jgi:hypothetical protein